MIEALYLGLKYGFAGDRNASMWWREDCPELVRKHRACNFIFRKARKFAEMARG